MGPSAVDSIVPILGVLVALVPVLGATTILVLKYGLRPFVETMGQEMRGVDKEARGRLETQVIELSDQLDVVTHELRQLREAQDFDRKLLADVMKVGEGLQLERRSKKVIDPLRLGRESGFGR